MNDQNAKVFQNTGLAALIVIGNEILSGRTQDTNTAWLAARLLEIGISLHQVRVVPDIEAEIIGAVHDLKDRVQYVFTTGGIGPTHDDITAAAIARSFGTELELNEEAYGLLLRHYGSEQAITDPRRKMAMIPAGANLIFNPVSAAPGFQIGNVFVMAGVPSIMQGMFDDIRPRLQTGSPILSNTVSCTLFESQVAVALEGIQNDYPSVAIGSYPYFKGGSSGLSLVARSVDLDALDKATKAIVAMIRSLGDEPHALNIQYAGATLAI